MNINNAVQTTVRCNAGWLLRLTALMILFSCLNLTGCLYGINNWGKKLNELNTDLDRELWQANKMGVCLSSSFINERMSQRDLEIIEQAMVNTFQLFFPVHTPLETVMERLTSEAGAKCITLPNKNSNSPAQTICRYNHISLEGMQKFELTGWEIYDLYWQKDNFEFAISSQDDHLISAVGKVLDGECYDIDVNAYKSTTTIKFIKRHP